MFGARVISEAGGVRVRICGCETVGAGDGERERWVWVVTLHRMGKMLLGQSKVHNAKLDTCTH